MESLFSVDPPWIHVSLIGQERRGQIPSRYYQRDGMKGVVRVLRGHKVKSDRDLFNEIGVAYQFAARMQDGWFGENTNAMIECLEDLDNWLPADFYITVVMNSHELLPDDGDLAWFLAILHEAGKYWSGPITDAGQFNRSAIPFHTVFECPSNEIDELKTRIRIVAARAKAEISYL